MPSLDGELGPGHVTRGDVRALQETLWHSDEDGGALPTTVAWYLADTDPDFDWDRDDYSAYEQRVRRRLQRLVDLGLLTTYGCGDEHHVTAAGYSLLDRC